MPCFMGPKTQDPGPKSQDPDYRSQDPQNVYAPNFIVLQYIFINSTVCNPKNGYYHVILKTNALFFISLSYYLIIFQTFAAPLRALHFEKLPNKKTNPSNYLIFHARLINASLRFFHTILFNYFLKNWITTYVNLFPLANVTHQSR